MTSESMHVSGMLEVSYILTTADVKNMRRFRLRPSQNHSVSKMHQRMILLTENDIHIFNRTVPTPEDSI